MRMPSASASIVAAAALLLSASAVAQTNAPPAAAGAQAQRPRVGLVLSGGGARGLAHIGVLKVLKEMRVPFDCIAGTSMGALVGGATAAGVPIEEMIERIGAIDWDEMLVDSAPRPEQPFRVKGDDRLNLFRLEMGLRGTELLLPTGAASGYKLELFLRDLLERAGNFRDQDFDRLPLPFRAVATNLEDGTAGVFARGDLVTAMRASMSVPGAFSPVEIDGRLYVDGGLTDNLPVNVARKACADVVIAVNLGSPLLKRSELQSIVGVALQSINLLTEQNVRASLAALRPDDILIEPALGDFSAANFKEALKETVPIGAAAARAQAPRLAALSVSRDEYNAWLADLRARLPQVPAVRGVEVATALGRVNPQVIEAELANEPGIDLRTRTETSFDPVNLGERLIEVYGRGDFDRIQYSLVDKPGGRIALIEGVEKSWGPNYVRFGLALARDEYQSTFNAALQYRMTWLTASGTEWRNFVQVGNNTLLTSEIYQPLSLRVGAFVAPRIQYRVDPVLYFSNGQYIGQYDVKTPRVYLDFGAQNKYGEVRAGLFGGRLKADSSFGIASLPGFSETFGLPGIPSYDLNQAGYTASATFDQLDSLHFPSDGELLWVRTFGTLDSLGSDDQYNKTEVQATLVRSVGAHALQLTAYGGATLQGTLPPYDPFQLGGLLRGSGFNFQELFGDNLYLARAVYTYRYASLPPLLGRGVYIGGSLEATRARAGVGPGVSNEVALRPSASIFVGADTFLGAIYLAWGQTFRPENRGMWYLVLGSR